MPTSKGPQNGVIFKDTFCLSKKKCTTGHNIHDTYTCLSTLRYLEIASASSSAINRYRYEKLRPLVLNVCHFSFRHSLEEGNNIQGYGTVTAGHTFLFAVLINEGVTLGTEYGDSPTPFTQ